MAVRLSPPEFDHERLLQVLANLIGNAIKFSKPGARISIRVESSGGEARVAVSDTGPGIRTENLEATTSGPPSARCIRPAGG